jgi:hypothetical protein
MGTVRTEAYRDKMLWIVPLWEQPSGQSTEVS